MKQQLKQGMYQMQMQMMIPWKMKEGAPPHYLTKASWQYRAVPDSLIHSREAHCGVQALRHQGRMSDLARK